MPVEAPGLVKVTTGKERVRYVTLEQVRMMRAIRNVRLAAGLSQRELGKVLGVSQKAVSNWECGLVYSTSWRLLRTWWSGPWRAGILIAQIVREAFP